MTAAVVAAMRPRLARLRAWAGRVGLYRKLALALTVAAVASGVATVMAWTGAGSRGPDPDTVVVLLYLDCVLLLLLGAVVSRRLVRVWVERRQGLAGSGLHVRIVLMFSLVAVTPAILVAVFSALFLQFGVQVWFSDRVRTAVEAADAVAAAYLKENQQNIRAEAFALANDLNREAPTLMADPDLFSQLLTMEAEVRSLPEALVVDSSGRVLAYTPLSLSLQLDLMPRSAFEKADTGQVAVLTQDAENRVRAVVKLNRFVDAYLLVGRFIDPQVLGEIQRTGEAVAQYQRLEQRREGILITFVAIFIVVSLLLLLAAVWTGLTLASQISHPISGVIAAAERVRRGDLSVRVMAEGSLDEIDTLGRAFNRMTSQVETQRESLMIANRELDERRRFTEMVLSGVSAGVIGLDRCGLVNLPNRSASDLLGIDLEGAIGRPLVDIIPEMRGMLDSVRDFPDRAWETEIKLTRHGRPRTLLARIAAERVASDVLGFVMTFDDITALVAAQRSAAWADVARRVAHEIKNPLTPIQLAAERLKRKYLREIESDPETFVACTDTIVRRVEDIRQLVDEFSSFARMPKPQMNVENLVDLVRQAVFLERNRNPHISFRLDVPDSPVTLSCDSRQVTQVLTNIMKNAAEAIVDGGPTDDGCIWLSLRQDSVDAGAARVSIVIEDNGPGLPAEQRERLTEPYVTTRARGTGLGLAIVKKIMEDHNGDLILEDRVGGGARVALVFYKSTSPLAESAAEDPSEVPLPASAAAAVSLRLRG